MTPEQIQKISALGYIVVNHGQHVEDTNKNIVMSRNTDGTYTTDNDDLSGIINSSVKEELEMIRARDEKGHFIADDPDTEVNEAWVVKTVKKIVGNK